MPRSPRRPYLSANRRWPSLVLMCERDHLIAFDFDPDIIGVGSQPFRFEFTGADGVHRGQSESVNPPTGNRAERGHPLGVCVS